MCLRYIQNDIDVINRVCACGFRIFGEDHGALLTVWQPSNNLTQKGHTKHASGSGLAAFDDV
jgi:hypothetical protein